MTDRESELIARLMNGDMDAFDELMPTAPNELRERVEFIVKNSNNPFVTLLLALMPQLCTKRIHYDPSPVMVEMAIERLLERGEISLRDGLSFDEILQNHAKVDAEIERINKTAIGNE